MNNPPKAKVVVKMLPGPEHLRKAENDDVWPGSERAQWRGCTCPTSQNHPDMVKEINGKRVFTIAEDCPVHGREKWA